MLLRPKPEHWISFRNGFSLWGYGFLSEPREIVYCNCSARRVM